MATSKNSSRRTAVPGTVKASGGLIALEGVVAIVIGVVELIRGLGMEHGRGAYGLAFWMLPVGAVLVAAGVGLVRGKRWGRAVAVLMSVMLVGAGASAVFSQGQPAVGVPILALGVVVLGLLFAPATVAWLDGEYHRAG